MRLWSVHPKYLDRRALVALWREGLLAQAILRGRTKGYRHHPRLARFRRHGRALAAVAAYLRAVLQEATRRGYRSDSTSLARAAASARISVTRGQLDFECCHLMDKVRRCDPAWLRSLRPVSRPDPHPLFRPVAGPVEDGERRPARARPAAASPASRRKRTG